MTEFINEFILFVVESLFWYVVISFALEYLMSRWKRTDIDDVKEQVHQHIDEIVHQVVIEKHGDMDYWFDSDNHEFLVQGKTTEEIVNALKNRFSDHVFLLNNDKIFAGPDFKMLDATPENLAHVLNNNKRLANILDK
jgi:hypothetical protein